MSDKDKYIYFLGELRSSKVTPAAEMSSLLYKNLIYYNTNDMSLEDCFNEAIELSFEDNDTTEQDLRSYNYIRNKLYQILQSEKGKKE